MTTTDKYTFTLGSTPSITEEAGGPTVSAGPMYNNTHDKKIKNFTLLNYLKLKNVSVKENLNNGWNKCIRIKTQIKKSYTETDSNVLTDAVLENIILNAQYRILRDVPIDADRKQTGNFVAGQESINAPAGCLFIRAIQVYDSNSEITGANRWLEKKDMSYLQEYQDITGTAAAQGQPKYYAMFGVQLGTQIRHQVEYF